MSEVSYENPEAGEARSASDGKIRTALVHLKETINGKLDHTNLSASAEIARTQLASEARPVRWYTPKVIATEESRTNTEYGFLATEDKIESVVLAENGLIVVGYTAIVKSSSSNAGRVAIFIGSNQLKIAGTTIPVAQEVSTHETGFQTITTTSVGLDTSNAGAAGTSFVTTGQVLASTATGGLVAVYAAAGTYTIGVKYKATSGSITAKERKLWVETRG